MCVRLANMSIARTASVSSFWINSTNSVMNMTDILPVMLRGPGQVYSWPTYQLFSAFEMQLITMDSGKFSSMLIISAHLLPCPGTDIYSSFKGASWSLCRRFQCSAGDKVIAAPGAKVNLGILRIYKCTSWRWPKFTEGHRPDPVPAAELSPGEWFLFVQLQVR